MSFGIFLKKNPEEAAEIMKKKGIKLNSGIILPLIL